MRANFAGRKMAGFVGSLVVVLQRMCWNPEAAIAPRNGQEAAEGLQSSQSR
jgi:hypothetical protein